MRCDIRKTKIDEPHMLWQKAANMHSISKFQ